MSLFGFVAIRKRSARFAWTVAGLLVIGMTPAAAQMNGGGTGTPTSPFSGVAVDASGVLSRVEAAANSDDLVRVRIQQSLARLDADVARPSKLRKVSLTRLLGAVNQSIADGAMPDETMERLAGLTRIRYVFYYPETKDIVLAGPAEGWVELPGEAGQESRVVGVETGAPVLELRDLAVALRTFAPESNDKPLVYCSIDPTQEGLARMQEFLSSIGRVIQPGDEQFIVDGLKESLGLQTISVGGVPAATHFAQVLVEADYRMKLIGIGLEEPPVRIASFVALANPAALARNALARWYFVPDYKRIKATEDGFAAEFVGNGVKLVGEDEVVAAGGGRAGVGGQGRASAQFTAGFTKNYPALAERAPVYAQLRNCIDMLIAAAFMQQHDLYNQAGIDLGALGNEAKYPVEVLNPPKQVASAVGAFWKGSRLSTPIGGGVEIHADQALEAANVLADESGEVAKAKKSIDLKNLPAGQWWWD